MGKLIHSKNEEIKKVGKVIQNFNDRERENKIKNNNRVSQKKKKKRNRENVLHLFTGLVKEKYFTFENKKNNNKNRHSMYNNLQPGESTGKIMKWKLCKTNQRLPIYTNTIYRYGYGI